MPASKLKTYTFLITMPALVPNRDAAAYIRDAVESWSGQFHPAHPLFGTLDGNVKVRSAARVVRYLDNIAKGETQ